MAYSLPALAVTGDIIASAWGNDVRSSLQETARLPGWLPASAAKLPLGTYETPATATDVETQNGGLWAELRYGDAATEVAEWVLPMPWLATTAPQLTPRLYWRSATATTGSAVWQVRVVAIGGGDAWSDVTGGTTAQVTAAVPGTVDRIRETVFTPFGVTGAAANDLMRIRLSRLGGNAADDLVGAASVIGMLLTSRPA